MIPVISVTALILADPPALGALVAVAIAESPDGAVILRRMPDAVAQADGDPGDDVELGDPGA